jgi:hypothetical protein
MDIQAGDLVEVTTASGSTLHMRALGSPQPGHLFPVVWVATEDEWERAQTEGDDADGIPWPTDAIRELTSA